MRIYCDIDDVLCETAVALNALAAESFGRRLAYGEIRDFDLQKTFGFTDGEMCRFMTEAHRAARLLAYEQTPGAVAALKALRASGHAIELVTGRPPTCWRATAAWLENVGLGGFDVVYVDKYARPCAADPEAPRQVPREDLAARGYDLAIDDSPLALEYLSTWPATRVIVFDRPWNRAMALAPNMTRVGSWDEILRQDRRI